MRNNINRILKHGGSQETSNEKTRTRKKQIVTHTRMQHVYNWGIEALTFQHRNQQLPVIEFGNGTFFQLLTCSDCPCIPFPRCIPFQPYTSAQYAIPPGKPGFSHCIVIAGFVLFGFPQSLLVFDTSVKGLPIWGINQVKHHFSQEMNLSGYRFPEIIAFSIRIFPNYPLVNIQKTMENHHFSWVNPL